MKSVYICLFLLCALLQSTFQQQQVVRLNIDNFDEGSNSNIIVLTSSITPSNPISNATFYTSTGGVTSKNILGGERDLQYTALFGSSGRVFSTSVSVVNGAGQWEISTPNGGNGTVLMQYDGIDGSMTLNVNGFSAIDTATAGGIDITEKGKGTAFHLLVETDILTTYTFRVYSPDGTVCTTFEDVESGTALRDATISFKQFTGNCDFNNVGAIEVYVDANENVDTITTLFTTFGDPDTNPSATPTPGVSPAPGVPGFTWYTVDDDFERLPCEDEPPGRSYFVSNQNIVYYYFYKFDEYVNGYYGSQLIVEISNSPALAFSLWAGIVALLAVY